MAIGYKITRETSDCNCSRNRQELELLYKEVVKGVFELIDPSLTCEHAEEIESEYFTARQWIDQNKHQYYGEQPSQEEIDVYLEKSDGLALISLLLKKEKTALSDSEQYDLDDLYALIGSDSISNICEKFDLDEQELRELYNKEGSIW